jgi:c-di-GMP-binding flagellar brake protein YcgR
MTKEFKERRGFVRANVPCKIIVFLPQRHEIDSHTENIGAGGVKVVIEEKLEISSIVELRIYLEREPIVCKGRVVWVLDKVTSSAEQKAVYDTGIEFYEIKEEDRMRINNFVRAITSGKEK